MAVIIYTSLGSRGCGSDYHAREVCGRGTAEAIRQARSGIVVAAAIGPVGPWGDSWRVLRPGSRNRRAWWRIPTAEQRAAIAKAEGK